MDEPTMNSQQALDKAVEYLKSEGDDRTKNNAVRHQYRVLNDAEKSQMVAIKDLGLNFLSLVDKLGPTGREYSIAKTKIEEAVMWAVKGITG